MTTVATRTNPVRCWDVQDSRLDALFATDALSDTALDAARRAQAMFSPDFPGWKLYRRVVAGVDLFNGHLDEWATTSARMLAGSLRDNGRDYIGPKTRAKPLWIAQAGRDGLGYAIHGQYAEGLHERAERFGVAHKTYQKIRDPVGRAMWIGLETFRAQLHAEYWRVREDERRGR